MQLAYLFPITFDKLAVIKRDLLRSPFAAEALKLRTTEASYTAAVSSLRRQ